MFLARGSLQYDWKKTAAKLEPHVYAELRRDVAESIKLPEQAEVEGWSEYGAGYYGDLSMDDRVVGAFAKVGIEVTLKNVKGLDPRSARNIENTIYQIAVPDIGLMTIKNVDYLINADLHDINAALDRGWRILCVLPPRVLKDDEYPTYVIGNTKVPD